MREHLGILANWVFPFYFSRSRMTLPLPLPEVIGTQGDGTMSHSYNEAFTTIVTTST
jgi:hypothetical protein